MKREGDNVNKFTSPKSLPFLSTFFCWWKNILMIYTLDTRPKKGYTFLPLLLLPGNKFEIYNNRIIVSLDRLIIDPLGREKLLDGGGIDFCTDDICIIMLE